MVDTAISKHNSRDGFMESSTNTIKDPTKDDTIRQKVPLKRERPLRTKSYVSPFLADKAKIDTKFVHLQCVWRDLEKSRKLGKKVIKERPIDHKPRAKIKRKENFLDEGVAIKSTGIAPEFQTGFRRLLHLERQLDENDNEMGSTKLTEYKNVVHKKEDQPTEYLFAIQEKGPSTNVGFNKNVDLTKDPSSLSRSSAIKEKAVTRKITPLKLSTKSLRTRSASNSSEVSLSDKKDSHHSGRTYDDAKTEPSTKSLTLIKTNSPTKFKTENIPNSRVDERALCQETNSNRLEEKTKVSVEPNRVYSDLVSSDLTRGVKDKAELDPTVNDCRINKSSEITLNGQEIKQSISLNCPENKITSVRIQLDSSFSEDDHQLSTVHVSGERKSSVKSRPDSPQAAGKGTYHNGIVLEGESDNDMSKPNQEKISTVSISVGEKYALSPHTPIDRLKTSNDFREKRQLFENQKNISGKSPQEFKERRKMFEKQEKVSDSKRNIAAKLQNIQSNIHKIVTDIKQSKQATKVNKPDDLSSRNTSESTMENKPLKTFPNAKQQGIYRPISDKGEDKELNIPKELNTNAPKTNANVLVTQSSKMQEKSQVVLATPDTRQFVDNMQTINGNQHSVGKLSDAKKTDNLTFMIDKRASDTLEKRKDIQSHENKNYFGPSEKKHLGDVTSDSEDNEKNETSYEIVPMKGGGQKRIVRHRSSEGTGQDPEDVATDLQKELLTSKKVIESQLAGILDKRFESDNLVGALKRSMTKPTAGEKVAAATHDIHEIIQNGIIQEENGSRIYQVKVEMGPFIGEINYTQDGCMVLIEGSTVESPVFTKEIKVEFPTQGLDMELLSVHSIGSVVELNVPFLPAPSQTYGSIQYTLDQYIYDEVSALKREYMQPWMETSIPPSATITENSLVMSPSSLKKYMTDNDIKQADELEIKPGEETKDIVVNDLDPPNSPSSRRIPPLPKFAPPAPPTNGIEVDEKLMTNSKNMGIDVLLPNAKKSRRHRRNTSQSSNASVSSSDTSTNCVVNSNNDNNDVKNMASVESRSREKLHVVTGTSNLASPKNPKARRSRKHRHIASIPNEDIGHNSDCKLSVGPGYSAANISTQGTVCKHFEISTDTDGKKIERFENVTFNRSAPPSGSMASGIERIGKPKPKPSGSGVPTITLLENGGSFKRDRSFRRSGKRRSLRKKDSNTTTEHKQTRCSPDFMTDGSASDSGAIERSFDKRYKATPQSDSSDSSDPEGDRNRLNHKFGVSQTVPVPEIQVTEASSSEQEY